MFKATKQTAIGQNVCLKSLFSLVWLKPIIPELLVDVTFSGLVFGGLVLNSFTKAMLTVSERYGSTY